MDKNLWFVAAVVLFILEILTPGVFFFACLALGAVFAGLYLVFYDNRIVSWVIFILVSIGSIYIIRPIVKRYLKTHKKKSNVDALIGRKTIVLEKITPTEMGLVKIDGELWKASSQEVIEIGASVEVIAVEGTHIVVKAVSGQ